MEQVPDGESAALGQNLMIDMAAQVGCDGQQAGQWILGVVRGRCTGMQQGIQVTDAQLRHVAGDDQQPVKIIHMTQAGVYPTQGTFVFQFVFDRGRCCLGFRITAADEDL